MYLLNMKKIVRLTESDLTRIIKKVLNENKRLINEDEKIDWVSVGVINPDTQGLLNVNGETWKMKLPNQNGYNEYLVVKKLERNGNEVCIGNPDWGWITKYCLDEEEQKEFSNRWWNASQNKLRKFDVSRGRIEFIK